MDTVDRAVSSLVVPAAVISQQTDGQETMGLALDRYPARQKSTAIAICRPSTRRKGAKAGWRSSADEMATLRKGTK